MSNNRLTEFITVLIFAMAIGAGAMLSILYLGNATARGVALVALVTAAILAWQYLRRRFRRGQ